MHRREKERPAITRRDLLEGVAYGSIALALGLLDTDSAAEQPLFDARNPAARVVLVRNENVLRPDGTVNRGVVQEMLDTAVKTLTGKRSTEAAWGRFVRPNDTVGLKFTRCTWMKVHTHQEVIDAVRDRVQGRGIPPNRIHSADYGLPVKECTALINIPSIKVHTLTGIAVSIKNYINFTGQESSYHHEGNVKLGEAWLLPDVKGKTRLIVVDALRPYFGPGPQLNPLHQWDYKGIFVSTDPVAVDTVCLALCQRKRNLFRREEWPITPPPKGIAAADTEYHLGTSDPRKIKLIRVGWQKDVLI
ncbi:MAG: DUF362 domain-containing protein [Armatimonadota bacterium]